MSTTQRNRSQSPSDCVSCQQLVQGDIGNFQSINTQELYSRIKTGQWSLIDTDDWRLFSEIMEQCGFVEGSKTQAINKTVRDSLDSRSQNGLSACQTLPSRVAIVAILVLETALKYLKNNGTADSNTPISLSNTISLERVCISVQFAGWVCGNPLNRRVLLHHDIFLLVCQALSAMRVDKSDVFNAFEPELLDIGDTTITVPDICNYSWESALYRSSPIIYTHDCLVCYKPRTSGNVSAARRHAHRMSGVKTEQLATEAGAVVPTFGKSTLFQNVMSLLVRLLDPERIFCRYLLNIESIHSLAGFSLVNTHDFPSELLCELVHIWRRLEGLPSRSRFSPTVVSLCCAIGSAVASGWIDAQLSKQHELLSIISKAMGWLDIDEAYLAWRLVILLGEQHPELSRWDISLEARVAGFWKATLERSIEYIQTDDISNQSADHGIAQHRSLDNADIKALDQIFSAETQSLLLTNTLEMPLYPRVSGSQQANSSWIRPGDISVYVADIDSLIPDTRFRRALDTVIAAISQITEVHDDLPPLVVASLAAIHKLFTLVAITKDSNNTSKNNDDGDGDGDEDDLESNRVLIFEYVRFLWRIWLLELPIALARCVFRTVSMVVWDMLLSLKFEHVLIDGITSNGRTPSLISGTARRVYVLIGWLLSRSDPIGSADSQGILESAICKLAFSRITSTVAATSKAEHMRFLTAGNTVAFSAASSRSGKDTGCLQSIYVSQALMMISWLNIDKFRAYLHETQAMVFLISAIRGLSPIIESLSKSQSTEFITQSFDNLSIVSIPEESAWNLAGCQPETTHLDQVDALTCRLMNLIYIAIRGHCDESQETGREGAQYKAALSEAAYSTLLATEVKTVPSIAWQLCNARIDDGFGSSSESSSLVFLSALASNRVPQLAMFSKELSIYTLCWLLSGSYNAAITFGDVRVGQKQRLDTAQKWMTFVISWIVPDDINSLATIIQHTRLLRTLRISFLDALYLADGSQNLTAMIKSLVKCDILQELLGLAQLVCTIDPSCESVSGSLFSSFGSRSRHGRLNNSEDIGRCVGELVCELTKLVALLIHELPEAKSIFAGLGGYKAIHLCIATTTQTSATAACLPLAEGVMSLLSGVGVPYKRQNRTERGFDKDWIPTLTILCSRLSLADCVPVHQFITQWCKDDLHVCLYWSQSTIARQSIERIQNLITDGVHLELESAKRHALIAEYLRSLERMLVAVMSKSMCVSDLKLALRTLVSGLSMDTSDSEPLVDTNEVSELSFMLRRMLASVLLRCAEREVGGSYFSFGGYGGAICSTNFYRVPERGFTFTAWINPKSTTRQNKHWQHLLSKRSHGALQSLENSENASQHHSSSSTSTPAHGQCDGAFECFSQVVMRLPAGNSGTFCILYDFVSQRIEVQVTESDSQHTTKCEGGLVVGGKWTSIAVCYTHAKRGWSPFSSSNLHIYIDGELAGKSSVPFIDHRSYNACYIGSSPELRSSDHHGTTELLDASTSFSGRIANIRMFDGALRISEIEMLHYLGPRNTSLLRQNKSNDLEITMSFLNQPTGGPAPKNSSLSENIAKDTSATFKSGDLAARLILFIGADATHDRTCADLSPIGICQTVVQANMRQTSNNQSNSWNSDLNVISLEQPSLSKTTQESAETRARLEGASRPWRMLGDVLSVNTTTIHQSMHLIGGIETALIFLYHLDWIGPAVPPAKEGPLGSEERAFDQTSLDSAPLPTFFYWLRNLIRGDPRHIVGISSTNIVLLIAHILQQQLKDPGPHLSVAALRAIQSFQTAFDGQGGLLAPVYAITSSFWSQVQRELVLNLKIWRRADYTTQAAYLRCVHHILCDGRVGDKQGKRSNASAGVCGSSAGGGAIGIRWLLYALFNFYPYDSSQHIFSQQQYSKSRSGSMAAQSPPSNTSISTNVEDPCNDKRSLSQGRLADGVGDQIPGDTAGYSDANDDSYGSGGAEPSVWSGGKILEFPVLSHEETKCLRKVLVNTLEMFLSRTTDKSTQSARISQTPEANRADIAHLVHHLIYSCNRDIEHTREILHLLFRCLADGSPNATSLAHKLLGLRGFDMLCHIIECDDDKTAAVAINIVVLLLTKYSATKEQESTASRITNSLRGRSSLAIEPDDISRVLALVRAKRGLTPALYLSLLPLAFSDHASLLSSINLAPITSGVSSSLKHRRVHHVRNLSVSQSPSHGSATAGEGPDTDILRSFVGLLPARLIKIPDAWSAIFDLSCASNTDPELRPIVLMDFYRLLEDDPVNYDTANSSRFKLLDHLIVAIVLAGCLVDDNSASLNNATSSNMLATDPKTLSEMYSKVTGFLELIPHTTLDYNMQNLSTGHIKAHKSWIQNRIAQLRSSADTTPKTWDQSQTFDNADELQTRASSELMSSMLVWSKTSCTLFMAIVWNSFSSQPGCADDVYMFVLKLWPLMPTGSMSIAIRLLLLVFSESQMRITRQLREEQSVSGTAHVLDWVLTQNLESFVQDALDLLFNYRQFQEYIAHNHDQLKTMSTVSQPSGPRVSIDDHDIVYHSQHSPWDDTPELTRAIVDFMFCLDQCGSGLRAPMCNHILRLVISGIRSVKMEHVEESLKSLARVLDYHPYLGTAQGVSLAANSGYVCSGGCSVGDQVLSTLGYVHEAFMFAEDQTDSTRFDNPDEQSSCSRDGQVELRERLGELYMLVFQGYHAYLASEYPAALLPLRLQQQRQRQRQGGGGGSLDKSQFVAFLQSEEWQGLYRTKFMPAMRKTEESEMRQAGMSRSKFADTLREILVGSQRQESMQMRAVKAAQTAIANSTLPIEADETASVRSEILGSPTGHWPRVWRERLRSLSLPRGPWRSTRRQMQLAILGRQRWMLDATENNRRMRRRLVQNLCYEDHHLAASRRDRTGQPKKTNKSVKGDNDVFDDGDTMPQLSLSISDPDGDKGQDASGDEEWNLVTSEDLNIVSATKGTAGTSDPRRAHFAASCERVALLGSVAGHVEITSTLLRFTAERDSSGSVCVRGSDGAIVGVSQNHANVNKKGRSLNPKGPTLPKVVYAELTRDITWRLSDIDQVHFRRYMLRNSAVEVFFKDHSSVFMNIENKKALMQLVWKLASLPSVNSELALTDIRSPPALLNRTKLTERWQHGELSNFDYLMALNTIAGRSYNDLSQYPVFPWVICDYKSKWLDLKDPRVYRDLSRPIGALNEKRLSHFIERYESFEDPTGRIKKFHYGTHYSSASAVAYYLLRLEPFTSVHVSLQSGKFDHADRQFYSIAETWNSCMTGPGDVKELIPEFFYLPEFLVNSNGVDLGKKQDGTLLGDVSLPPWASTPDEFVQIHRQALESEYVSANLHKWIDLVFGYKQRGHEAIKAHNVFYYLTYEGAVNLDAIQDPVERASVESQIHYFGQTPTQLFSSPHPPRHAPIARPLYSPLTNPGGKVQHFILRASNSNITFVGSSQCFFSERRRAYFNSRSVPWTACVNPPNSLAPLPSNIEQLDNGGDGVDTQRSTETITLVDSNGGVSIYQLSLFTNSDYKFQLTVEPFVEGFYMLAASSPPSECQRLALADQRPVAYAVLPNLPELIVSAVHFDNTLKCARLTRNRESAPAETTVQASLVRNTALSASTTMSMTNAYASAVVGAMSRETRELGERSSRVGDKSTTSSATSKRNAKESSVRSQASSSRTLSGILASIGGNVGGSGAAKSGREHSDIEVHDYKSGMSAPPSVFIPLASRLLDTTSAFSDIPLPGQQMCVAADGCGGSRVAVGSSDGSICILNIGVSTERTSGSTTAAIAATAMFGSDFATSGMERTSAMAPLLFATGMGNPMDVEIGHTSMAAYASSTSSPSALFGEGRSAIGGGIAGGSSGGSASGSNAGGYYNSSVGDGKAGSWTLQHVLHGHDAAVLDVAVDSDHDVVAGASVDGTVSLWTVRTGRYLRSLVPVCPSIAHPDDAIPTIACHQNRYARVERVLISSKALVICYSVSGALGADDNRDRLDSTRAFNQTLPTMPGQSLESESGSLSNSHSASSQDRYSHYYNSQKSNVSDGSSRREGKAADDNNPQGSPIDDGAFEIAALHVYTINGRHLRTRKLVHHLRDIALTKDGKYGVCVNLNSRVAIFETNTLSIVRQFELPACGCSVAWSGASERQIIVGCEGGLVVVISADLSVVH